MVIGNSDNIKNKVEFWFWCGRWLYASGIEVGK